ncbi:sigma-70 family RNA polymerase sigma factor [Paludicola sp. MB14-C6]|uniref:sigma-70 family RNA polymerase sigma factor n=1 Tax=Paludihabitans sp. MB14-C6 TaxID=3070656 RepID=UPI0027DCC2AD|nr:sigma-70 family RNA polymerase sigma factor [Paludicola sp. MB14-C6]WMJ22410.1 sigma-70 family RNA polymerase sigma factor [Paludicola sp. MB14-C6]
MDSKPISQAILNKNDVELLECYRSGNQEAVACIFARYASVVNRNIANYYIAGIDKDDLKQEALMGLFNAIRSYKQDRNASFNTYANHCIANRLKNFLAASSTNKAQVLNRSIPIEEVESYKFLEKQPTNPESIFIQKESYQSLVESMNSVLSNLEREVMNLYLCGCDYRLIASKLNSSQKTVDNALQRARRKLKAVFNHL